MQTFYLAITNIGRTVRMKERGMVCSHGAQKSCMWATEKPSLHGKGDWRNAFAWRCSVTQLCLTLCDPRDGSMPCFSVLHYLPEFVQIHVHWVNDAIQSSHLCCPLLLLPSIFPSISVICLAASHFLSVTVPLYLRESKPSFRASLVVLW